MKNYSDGYIYKVTTWYYGKKTEVEYSNSVTTRKHMDEYYGDNGIVLLETNNKEFAEEVRNHECLNGEKVVIL